MASRIAGSWRGTTRTLGIAVLLYLGAYVMLAWWFGYGYLTEQWIRPLQPAGQAEQPRSAIELTCTRLLKLPEFVIDATGTRQWSRDAGQTTAHAGNVWYLMFWPLVQLDRWRFEVQTYPCVFDPDSGA